jgi:hypothetical protein
MHRSNQQQLARKAAEADEAKRQEAAFKAAWGERLAALRAEEQAEREEARAQALKVGWGGGALSLLVCGVWVCGRVSIWIRSRVWCVCGCVRWRGGGEEGG